MSEEKKDKVIKLYKECGQEMKVNEHSLKHALSIGWKKEKPKK